MLLHCIGHITLIYFFNNILENKCVSYIVLIKGLPANETTEPYWCKLKCAKFDDKKSL